MWAKPVTDDKLTERNKSEEKWENVRFEVFMAVSMKNAVFWDIGTQFIPHRKHITSPLHSPAG
jgi:hypothetical protein